MKVYVMRGSTSSCSDRVARRIDEGFPNSMVTGEEKRFRYPDLLGYGLSEGTIQSMLDSGFLKEVYVDRKTALSIAGYHKCRTDLRYKAAVLDALEGARAHVDQEARMTAVRKSRSRKYSARR